MKIPFTSYSIKRFNGNIEQQYRDCAVANERMANASHARFHIINAFLKSIDGNRYLEVGVRNPEDNFNRIDAEYKVSVDPGYESETNLATYPMTSDQFFEKLKLQEIEEETPFDVIFLDGLHLADQLYRDILNALKILSNPGYLILHDCNPPTHHHARENFKEQSPATHFWNGTCWKAFQRFRTESNKRMFVVDVDWGVGVIANHEEHPTFRLREDVNPFYEFSRFHENREEILNLRQPHEIKELSVDIPKR